VLKAVALLVVIGGYVLLVDGVNHITGGCLPLKSIVWPSSSSLTDPCKASSSAPAVSTTPTGGRKAAS
jgi:hypothetical protein